MAESSNGNLRRSLKSNGGIYLCTLLIFVLILVRLSRKTIFWPQLEIVVAILTGGLLIWSVIRIMQKPSGTADEKEDRIGESLSAQRIRLQSSWNETLEAKMRERTTELSARNKELNVLFNFAVSMNRSLDQTEITAQYLDVIKDYVKADGVIILLTAEGSGELLIAGSRGPFIYRICRGAESAPGHCACRAVIAGGKTLSFTQHGAPNYSEFCFRSSESATVLPLQSSRGSLGVVVLAGAAEDLIVKETRDLMLILSTQVSLSLERAQTQQKLSHIEAQREVERLKAQFLSSLSHELRTPLGIIKGYVATLMRDDAPMDEAMEKEFLEIISDETKKLQSMVDTLLDAARMQAGQLPVSKKRVNLGELITSSVERLRTVLADKGPAVTISIPPEELIVIADPLRIEQVIRNLIENAVNYSGSPQPIEVAIKRQGSDAVISVKDYGVGISPEEMKSIFEPFYRGAAGSASGNRGAGLGLTICKRIVDAHDGKIWVESKQGNETTFSFTLQILGA